jgi:hypothetical protein
MIFPPFKIRSISQIHDSSFPVVKMHPYTIPFLQEVYATDFRDGAQNLPLLFCTIISMNGNKGIDKSIIMEGSHAWLKKTRLSRNLQWINDARYGFCLSFHPFLFSSFAVCSNILIPSFPIVSVAFVAQQSKLVPSANLSYYKMMSAIKELWMGHCLKSDD